MKVNKKGFTLIELLIVVAIIGILAGSVLVGLGPAQRQGRDSRRLSDLKQVQNALELYYAKNQQYADNGDWAAVSADIVGSGVAKTIPKSPSTDSYYYATDANRTSYYLGAWLENASGDAKNSSFVGALPAGVAFPNGAGSCGAEAAGKFFYCVSL